jgi:hypothetical protein
MVIKQKKKRPIRYKPGREGLIIPPIKMKRISRNSYPVGEEGVLSGFPKNIRGEALKEGQHRALGDLFPSVDIGSSVRKSCKVKED